MNHNPRVHSFPQTTICSSSILFICWEDLKPHLDCSPYVHLCILPLVSPLFFPLCHHLFSSNHSAVFSEKRVWTMASLMLLLGHLPLGKVPWLLPGSITLCVAWALNHHHYIPHRQNSLAKGNVSAKIAQCSFSNLAVSQHGRFPGILREHFSQLKYLRFLVLSLSDCFFP